VLVSSDMTEHDAITEASPEPTVQVRRCPAVPLPAAR